MALPTQQQWEDIGGEGIDTDVWFYAGPVNKPELTTFGFEGSLKWADWVAFSRRILEQDGK